MEIERKWLFNINEVPIELSSTITYYTQGYLSINPEVRVRSKVVENLITNITTDKTYRLCIKGEGTLTRHEIQKDLTKEEYEDLLEVGNLKSENLIQKRYYTILVEQYMLTVGIVDEGSINEFCYGEIEFDCEEEAKNFNPPTWFGKDVTNDKSYKMKNYWKRTRLDRN
ncbi:CYTH domain-containing protein [Clostridium sp. ZS1]|uniref:CYTH domain-containing protein n=1 Tax=Clostridium sp. ZS1 TaxID=2949989 RepID=UPI00207AA6BF|nr:CYTH domain-containing protein [Clostridium sp. ZS1]